MTLLDLIEAMHGDAERVRAEASPSPPKSAGGTRFNSSKQWPSSEDHHIAIGAGSPHLAEESGSSW